MTRKGFPAFVRRSARALIMTMAVCASCADSAVADSAEPLSSDLYEKKLEELLKVDVQKVSVASKRRQKVNEAPSSVTIITSDDIRQYGYRTIADILRSVRGFNVTYDRNYAYIGVRGFGRPGDYNTRVLLMVDGHAINDNIFDTAPIGAEFTLDVDLIDRIEISRGPGSALYGSNALFGVINVVTKNGSALHGVEGSGEIGRDHAAKGRISYGRTIPGESDLLLSGNAANNPGRDLYFAEFDPANPAADPRAANNGIAVGRDYETHQNAFTKATAGDLVLSAAYGRREKGIPTAAFGTMFNAPDTVAIDRHAYVDARYSHEISGRSDIMARLAYDEYGYAGDYPFDTTVPPGAPSRVVNKDESVGRWWSGEINYTAAIREKHTIVIGTTFKANTTQDQRNFNADPYELFLNDRRRSNLWALFGQDEIWISPSLILTAGARYDYYDTFGGTTNPRAGLLYYPSVNSAVKLLAGRAFRTPNTYELYYNDGYITSEPNPNLRPETIVTYEAVYEQYYPNQFQSTLSVYHYDIQNLITLEQDPANGLLVYRNAEAIAADGVEFELQKKCPNGTRGTFSTAYQHTFNRRTGELLINSPRNLTKLNLSVPMLKEHIIAGLEEQYTGRRWTLGENTTEAFFVTNVTILAQNMVKGLDLSLGVYNLFDKQYRDPASEEHRPALDSIEQDGRVWRLKVTYLY